MVLPQKNDIIDIEITALSSEGAGIGRYDGIVVFVPQAIPGDSLSIKIVKVLKNRMYGVIQTIKEPSLNRVENSCQFYPQCGGCSLRHMDYKTELAEKVGYIRDSLRKIGGVTPTIEEGIPSPKIDRYRNKAQYPVRRIEGKATVGFYASRSHRLIPLDDCLLQPKIYSKISDAFCEFLDSNGISIYDESTGKGVVRHLCIRSSKDEKEIMVTVVISTKELPDWEILLAKLKEVAPSLKTLTINHNFKKTNVIMGREETILYGEAAITDKLCGVKLEISSLSFYQVNRDATQHLYEKVLEYAQPSKDDIVLDLYCGIGSIGLTLAGRVKNIIGIEVIEQAVINARKNAKINGVENAEFILADAAKGALELERKSIKPTIVVVDPPRKGLDEKTIDAIVKISPNKVVYVSCNPATLARDVKLFIDKGYNIKKAVGVDLFPRTTHIESVVLIEK